MRGLIPDNLLEDILSRVDLVELVSSYIPLKKTGKNFKACCPFHHEKTPSFVVSADRQIYHCFGCGESGNAFRFLMRYERMEFPEAVEVLAGRTGVVLPEISRQDDKASEFITQLYKVNELAVAFYENNLNSAEGLKVREYLLKRGIKPQFIKEMRLGYARESWDALINHLRAQGFSLALLDKAGLIVAKDSGGYYDRFRNRLIIPIFDIKGRPLAFGARVLDNSLPKYINSPETPLYTKGRHLFGLNLAKEAIRQTDKAIIVEGYLDCIIPHQEGLKNIVASQGTALTLEQCRLLKRHTNNIVVVYDPDKAGELAALRSLDIFIEEEMEVRVVSLPQGYDPDLFVRKDGIEALNKLIVSAQDLFDYKLKILKSHFNCKDISGKTKISKAMLETLNKIKNAVLKSEYLKKLAQELDISEDAVITESNKAKPDKRNMTSPLKPDNKLPNANPAEMLLIKLMLEETELINHIKDHLCPEDFQNEKIAKIVSIMFELVSEGKKIGPNTLINHLPQEDVSRLICESIFLPLQLNDGNKEKVMDDCIRRLKSDKVKFKRLKLQEEIRIAQDAGNEQRLDNLIKEFQVLINEER
ncbi:MAG: DNA primase [Candidatus Omnitrophota bacterium]|jgi:DNA primase